MIPPLRPFRTPFPSPAGRPSLRRASPPAGWVAGAAVSALLAAAPGAHAQQTVAASPGGPQAAAVDPLTPPPPYNGDAGDQVSAILGRRATTPPPGPTNSVAVPPSTPGADGLTAKEIYVEADVLTDDKARKLVTGQGHVEARVDGRTLRADRLVYDTVSGLVRASGHVVIVNADSTVEYSQDTLLDDQLRTGVATGFSARLQKNVVVAAGAAIKRNENVTSYKSAIMTPCAICRTDGVTPRTPFFGIQANDIVEDRVHSIVYYHHAIIRVLGVPVIYTPLLWTPDPEADRGTGLLAPKFSFSHRRGFSYEQPYYVAISDFSDLTLTPQLNTSVNPFLQLHYRERFYSGLLDVRVGYTYDELFDNHGKYGDDTSRSYILAQGRFDLSKAWEWGFGLERVTDPTLLRRYNVRDQFEDRGPYPADTDRLISQIYTRRIDDDSLISVAALSFQSIRAYGTDALGHGLYESNKAFPVAAPLVEARWDPQDPVFGGRLRFNASAVVLTRNDPVVSAFDPTGVAPLGPERPGVTNLSGLAAGGSALTYTDSRQADAEVEWKRDFTLPGGLRLQPYLEARGDLYGVSDGVITRPSVGDTATQRANGFTPQGDGTVALTASWPLIRNTGALSVILEPIVQLAYSPRQKLDPNIPDEDSVAFEFDDTDLFSLHRLPGYDLYESGARANIGGRADFAWGPNGVHTAAITAGRVFRTADDTVFLPNSGLRGTDSDWVYGATVSPVTGVSFFVRQRLDADTLAVHRDEAGVSFSNSRFNVGVSYQYNENGLFIDTLGHTEIGRTEDASLGGGVTITNNWALGASISRDLRLNVFPTSQVILTYHNDCVRVDTIYTHDETYAAVIGTSDSLTVRLTLAILGATNHYRGSSR